MARPRTIQDSVLLTAAREVFVEQGFSATTASIAVRAGVSEGTLFKRFSTKEDLFAAALGLSDYGAWRDGLLASVGQDEVQRNLERAAMAMLAEAQERIQNLVAVFSRGIDPSHNPMMQKLSDPSLGDEQAFAAYLGGEMEAGRVRPVDVQVTAVLLVGALGTFIHRECLPHSRSAGSSPPAPPPGPSFSQPLERGRFVRGVLDVLWPGLKP
ncbi:TetR/AcrR family transcriptional regulator [Deinococcus fonticola]|uniref:TetR/AcrR family transcriptional regulator n=1 Tax=Deinococcus fonticola TaxID=2528713 RepID=UPI0010756EA4|nr:TetR/AcrR family transcriptional regulator [Deinococcus fonticola]